MFACQNYLQKSCRKCYKEQKLFYGHRMKMNTSCSKSAFKAVLGSALALNQFARSILKTSYLSIQADLGFALVDNVVELS